MQNDNFVLILSSLGIAQSLFLMAYLLTLKKGNRKAQLFLTLLILGLTLRIGKSIFNVHYDLAPWQRNLGIAGILLVGPSLWWYGQLLFHKIKEPLKRSGFHFIPYMLFTLWSPFIPNRSDTVSLIIYVAVFVHLLFYVLFALRLLLAHRKSVRSGLYVWYRNLIMGVALIWLFYMGNLSGLIPFYIGGALFFSLLIYMFSFLLLRQHTFTLEKYQGSSLDYNTSKQLMASVKTLFSAEEVFLDNSLSLHDVAALLQTSPRNLSRTINENEQVNFSEFVNRYRVNKAKELLSSAETAHEKLATIAYDSGFGNVTSFNTTFKGVTKLTPSQFRKQFGTM
ncbi:MAG: helix-turn-helix domain-containing protein [Bacteroidota bacterium]